jgi:hypothetical protein
MVWSAGRPNALSTLDSIWVRVGASDGKVIIAEVDRSKETVRYAVFAIRDAGTGRQRGDTFDAEADFGKFAVRQTKRNVDLLQLMPKTSKLKLMSYWIVQDGRVAAEGWCSSRQRMTATGSARLAAQDVLGSLLVQYSDQSMIVCFLFDGRVRVRLLLPLVNERN